MKASKTIKQGLSSIQSPFAPLARKLARSDDDVHLPLHIDGLSVSISSDRIRIALGIVDSTVNSSGRRDPMPG